MRFFSPVEVAQRFVKSIVCRGDTCVDATVGNGHDTLFLARLAGDGGKVVGLDIQADALANASYLMRRYGLEHRVTLKPLGHEHLSGVLAELGLPSVKLVMFNLGYLPGSDKSVITCPETTLHALDGCLAHLMPGGAISLVAYRGHAGGTDEYDAVEKWIGSLSKEDFLTVRYERWTHGRGQTPVFFWIRLRAKQQGCLGGSNHQIVRAIPET